MFSSVHILCVLMAATLLGGHAVAGHCLSVIHGGPLHFHNGNKTLYKVGVLAYRGVENAFLDFNTTFNDYLTAVVGPQFDPPLTFEMSTVGLKKLYEHAFAVDFMYIHPGAFSCIESEFGAQSLVSQISRRNIGGNIYDLTEFGGVIIARADNDAVNHITDLKGKIVAAASIGGLGAGQMQFEQMQKAGLSHITAPKQLIFTGDQNKIVNGVINGEFDVGFARTDQVERTKDENDVLVNASLLKIIDPKPNLTIDGVPFPFQSSTPLYPEWNLAAHLHIPPTVSEAVQSAMLAMDDLASYYDKLLSCRETMADAEMCDEVVKMEMGGGSDMTWEDYNHTLSMSILASDAMSKGKYAGWRPTLSYMQLRNMQETTGFIEREHGTNTWKCVRMSELYEAITCPAGQQKKSKEEVSSGCSQLGLECKEGFECICNPCVKPLVCGLTMS